ncbi:hypothetical protein JRQ81_010388 [Phrynocephalus forsythii]|uniref:Fibronectin type-III domain-containing protein n=1 Tax=Phrynocephalus forsythii TaxID=171643 RepID=A0A9Q0XAG0_9SAUR|nr:hypothetical protein JRQ81_010388 [Phrynocephalus forsythii]
MDARKPLRARKTMAPSSRKQMGALNKMKNHHRWGAERTSNKAKHNHGQLRTVETPHVVQTPVTGLNSEAVFSPQTLKEPVTNLVVNSKICIYNGCQEVAKDPSGNACTSDAEVKQFLNSETLQDIFYQWYGKEAGCPFLKPVEVHLNSASPPQLLDYSGDRLSGTTPKGARPASGREGETEEKPVSQTMPVLEPEGVSFLLQKKSIYSSTASDEAKRKRRVLEGKTPEHPASKHTRTSQEVCRGSSDKTQSGLAKIKSFIQKQLSTSMGEVEHHIQSLNERITRTQCLRKHEGIAIKIVNRISRLDRRINRMIELQKKVLSKKASLHSQYRGPNATASLPGETSGQSAPPNKPPSNPHEILPKEAERSDDVLCLGEVSRSPALPAPNPADVQRKDASVNTEKSAKMPCDPKLQNLVLIDLTDEQSLLPQAGKEAEKKVPERRPSAPESQGSGPPQPALQTFNPVSEEFSHLPPLPKIRLEPEPANGYQGTLPPQKLQLNVALVENPRGIALQWDVPKAEPRCAPIESFYVFMSLEYATSGTPTGWVKTNRLKALPLPMACLLSEVLDATKCYFTMQSRDIYGRYGPFSEIQSISRV